MWFIHLLVFDHL
jgi:hypothetical protein